MVTEYDVVIGSLTVARYSRKEVGEDLCVRNIKHTANIGHNK